MENSGIHFEGGSTANVGAMAAGQGAVAINAPVYPSTLDGLREALRDLERRVDAAAPGIPADSLGEVRHAVQEAEDEAARDAPDKGRLMTLLDRLRTGVGAVTQVSDAVAAVEKIVLAVT